MNTPFYKTQIVGFGFALLALCFFSMASATEYGQSVPADAQTGQLIGLKTCTYSAGDIDYVADCGNLVVSENRNVAGSRLISLPVVRVRATANNATVSNATESKNNLPLFWLRGGPTPNTVYGDDVARLKGLIEHHDFVMVGYRGVDGSVDLQCTEIVKEFSSIDNMLSDSAVDLIKESTSQCAKRLQGQGVDLGGYNMLEVIDDLEAARIAFGYERINLLSQSAGSRIAMIYAQRYPENLKRVVMYAAMPPGRGFFAEPKKMDEQLAYYAALCAIDDECSKRTDNLAETIRHVAQNMPKAWLFMPINEGGVKFCNWALLSNTSVSFMAPALLDAWLAAKEGDMSGLAMTSLLCDMILPSSINWGATYAYALSVDYDPALDYRTEMNPPDSILGAPASHLLGYAGAGWPTNFIPEKYRQMQHSNVETLVINSPLDFIAPPEYATNELMPYLNKGQQVILSDFGHTIDFWNLQPQARERLLSSFYDTGVADDSLYTYQPVNFDTGFGYPEMAKLLILLIVLIPLLLLALLYFVVRKVWRRKGKQRVL